MTTVPNRFQNNQRPFAWSGSNARCDQSLERRDSSPSDVSDTQPSSSSSRVFSPASSPSSQSSVSPSITHHDLNSQPGAEPWPRKTFSSQQHSQHGDTSTVDNKQRQHPRRTQARASWNRPSLIRQDQRRQQLVEQLVDAATQLVILIWPESDATNAFQNRVISLRFFIRETLRRSRTSYSTLQLTLWYLVLIKPFVGQGSADLADSDCSTPENLECSTGSSDHCKPLQCGRRMFLSALILSSKFIQDRNFTARAWSKITGLATHEIVSNEFLFLTKISWKLHLKEQDFTHWNSIIIRCTESTQLGRNVKDVWSTILDCLVAQGKNLEETSNALSSQWPMASAALTPNYPIEGFSGYAAGGETESFAFNFPACASPFPSSTLSGSGSPLVASGEQKLASTQSFTTPLSSSMSSLRSVSPARSVGVTNNESWDVHVTSSQIVRTPSPMDCLEERTANPPGLKTSEDFVPCTPPHIGNDNVEAQQSTYYHDAAVDAVMRAFEARQTAPTEPPRVLRGDFSATCRHEYRKQIIHKMLFAGQQQAQKRKASSLCDDRAPKSQCLASAHDAPCMNTPVAKTAHWLQEP